MTYAVDFPINYVPTPSKDKANDLGYMYFGQVNGDPLNVAQRVTVYITRQNNTPLAVGQPITLSAGGVPLYNGSPVQLEVDGAYSLTVLDKNSQQIYYAPYANKIADAIAAINTAISGLEVSVTTFAALGSTPAPYGAGQIATIRCHTSGTVGGGQFIGVAGSVTNDGGTQINSATVGIYWQRINMSFISPEMFGNVSGSTAIVTTRAINKAYVYAAANSVPVRYELLAYSIDGTIDGTIDDSTGGLGTRGGIQVKSRTVTIFTGQTFTQVATTSANYSLINCSNASNFSITGEATFIGDALIHTGVGGEYGHGLYLANSHDATISGLTIKTCWGDGCYISDTLTSTLPLGIATASSNITINDCVFNQNRRQGCSGINGTGIVFNRCQFINTGTLVSTPPSSGVDLETDASTTRNGMQDWTFNACIMSGNLGPNVQLFPTLNNGKAGCEDIQFNDCKMTNTSAQGSYWSTNGSNFVKNITVTGGVIEGGVYSGNATHFSNVKISKAVTDPGAGSYVVEQNATTFGAKYSGCEIRAIGDTTINSKKLFFGSTSGFEANKTEFTNCKFVAYSVYGGATNILLVTSTPTIFQSCEFLTEGTAPASFIGFDNTAGSSKVGPAFSMLLNCYIDPTWHSGSTSFQNRFNVNTLKTLSVNYAVNNLVPTAMADVFEFIATGSSNVTVNAPTDPFAKRITIRVKNTSGGALGTWTWTSGAGGYKMSAWTNPANGFNRSIDFIYNTITGFWDQVGGASVDIAN